MPLIPKELLNSLATFQDFDANAFIEAHQEEKKITTLRLNPFKQVELDFDLGAKVPWSNQGYYLEKRPSFTYDPLFHSGSYYVQEAGSMFIGYALQQTVNLNEKLRILDGCAAPGGKSTLLNALITPESLLISNEIIKSRSAILAQNLSRWGTLNTVVTNNNPSAYSRMSDFFDVILVDAPCSGSGLFRKQPEAIDEWSPAAVDACSVRQKKILEDYIPALKENGLLIYSTCSYSFEENEEIVSWLIKELGFEYINLPIVKEWGIVEGSLGYRFYPHLTQSEGFFCAVLRKTGGGRSFTYPRNKKQIEISKDEKALIIPFIETEYFEIIKKNERFYQTNSEVNLFLSAFDKDYYFRKAGVSLGEIKGKNLIPDHDLAYSLNIGLEVRKIELDYLSAINYLKKEQVKLPESALGQHLVTYKGQGLGWIKVLERRFNNNLPDSLRILN